MLTRPCGSPAACVGRMVNPSYPRRNCVGRIVNPSYPRRGCVGRIVNPSYPRRRKGRTYEFSSFGVAFEWATEKRRTTVVITEVRIKLMEDGNEKERMQAFCSVTFDDALV